MKLIPEIIYRRYKTKLKYSIYAISNLLGILLLRPVNFREEKFLKGFGKRLKELRALKKMTQEDLAYTSGISLSQIARIETGKINPTICTVNMIAKTLKVQTKDLLDF